MNKAELLRKNLTLALPAPAGCCRSDGRCAAAGVPGVRVGTRESLRLGSAPPRGRATWIGGDGEQGHSVPPLHGRWEFSSDGNHSK